MNKIRKNDQVIVITGKEKGKIGRVQQILTDSDRVIVEKVNLVKRHTKPTQKNPQGGILEKEASIHISNIMILDPKSGKGTKVGFKVSKDGTKTRYSKKTGETIEAKF